MTTSTELTLFADYFQIHVCDAEGDGDLSEAWRAARADVDSDRSPETTEQIRLQVWAAPESPTTVIKRWAADRF
ncbi:hypothetical protein ADL35_27975 [Streptomyces sp. NRRL WC-3753]|nr:hypothetical protein ADL35_27975 [Streptomyces sp. NRRL WC-3753]